MIAKSIPGLTDVLHSELKELGIKATLMKKDSTDPYVNFWANQKELTTIIHKCRIVNSLKMKLGPRFYAVHKTDFYKNLRKLNWHSFFPTKTDNYDEFFLPYPKCKSKGSSLYHTEMVEGMLQSFISKMPQKRKIAEFKANLPLDHHKTRRAIEGIKNEEHNQLALRDKQGSMSMVNSSNENLDRKELPTVEADLNYNQCQVYLNFNPNQLTKHGYRKYLGWGALSEDKIASVLIKSGLLKKWRESGEVKLFDPFCGSGSIIIEALLSILEIPIRTLDLKDDSKLVKYLEHQKFDNDTKSIVKTEKNQILPHSPVNYSDAVKSSIRSMMSWPVFDVDMYEELKGELLSKTDSLKNDLKFSVIGCDISKAQISNLCKNQEILEYNNIFDKINSLDTNIIKQGKNSSKILQKNRALWFVQEDFHNLVNSMINKDAFKGYDIITNLPYGKMSSERTKTDAASEIRDKNSLSDEYTKFDQFLRNHMDVLGDIYMIYPKKPLTRNHFIAESLYDWEDVMTFNSGTFDLGLYKCTKQRRIDTMAQVPTDLAQTLEEEKSVVTQTGFSEKGMVRSDEQKKQDYIISLMEKNVNSQKAKRLLESLKTKRRNFYLAAKKELWVEKMEALKKRREELRANKFDKVEKKMKSDGMSEDSIDELHQVVIEQAQKKKERFEKRHKGKKEFREGSKIPKW